MSLPITCAKEWVGFPMKAITPKQKENTQITTTINQVSVLPAKTPTYSSGRN